MALKGKHLTLDQRIEIQLGLKRQLKLDDIALTIDKEPRTISFEIKRNLSKKTNEKHLFTHTQKTICNQHKRYPFVCDGCTKKRGCLSDQYYYDAKQADALYKATLSHARSGMNLTMNELVKLNKVLNEGLKKGQSVEHIMQSNQDIEYSARSVYRHIELNNLETKTFHLRNKPKLKKRVAKSSKKADPYYVEGRSFIDFLTFISKRPGQYITQVDTVHGVKTDQKVILTMIVIELHFFYAFVLDKLDALSVVKAFDALYALLGHEDFKRLYAVILCDRGIEFSRPHDIEVTKDLIHRSNVFYCDPMASYQKGAVESIHRVLRYVFPKGKSIDFITQELLELVICSINNYKLRSNQFITAFHMMQTIFGLDLLKKLKVKAIDPDQIHLTPKLVK